MSRAVRITVGSVVAGVFAFVALVSGVIAAVGSGGGGEGFGLDAGVDTPATAEVLDVDVYDDWTTVDVRWTTPDGEVVVTYVDWEWGTLPEIGDEVEVLYDAADPELAYAADDPYVSQGQLDAGAGSGAGTDGAPDEGAALGVDLSRTAGWVSLASLLGLVVTTVVTVVAAVRAPAAPATAPVPGGFDVLPPLSYPAGPHPAGPYQQVPHQPTMVPQPSGPAAAESWRHPG